MYSLIENPRRGPLAAADQRLNPLKSALRDALKRGAANVRDCSPMRRFDRFSG
jgi:hypothetical protein